MMERSRPGWKIISNGTSLNDRSWVSSFDPCIQCYRFDMQDFKCVKTPAVSTLNKDCFSEGTSMNHDDALLYHFLVRKLIYAMIGTRLDLA